MTGEEFIESLEDELRRFSENTLRYIAQERGFVTADLPLPAFKTLIDEELKKAEERVAQGTPAGSYYKTWIVEKGLKKLEAPK